MGIKITFGEHVLKYNTKNGTNPEIVCARKGMYIKSFLPRSDTGPKMYKLFKFYQDSNCDSIRMTNVN